MYDEYYGGYDPRDHAESDYDPHVNEVDIIFERGDDGEEIGLTVSATTNGPTTIALVLEAIAIHDVNVHDPLQGMKEVLEKYNSFERIRIFRGNSEAVKAMPELTLANFEQALPGGRGYGDRVWHLRLDYPGREIAIKHPDGPAVLRGPLDAPSAKELSTSFFTQLTEALDHFAPTATAGNVFIIFERDGTEVSGVHVHMPQNAPDALSCVLSWLKDTDRGIVAQPERAATGIVRACRGIDPVIVPFKAEEDYLSAGSLPFSNDCPIVIVDCPESKLRLHAADKPEPAEAKLHKTGAGQIRKELHQIFRENGISLEPDYHDRYGWQRNYAGARSVPF